MGFRYGVELEVELAALFEPPAGQIDVGDVQNEGASSGIPRADHTHAFPAPTGPPPGLAGASDAGASARPATQDHTHAHTAADHLGGGHADLTGDLAPVGHTHPALDGFDTQGLFSARPAAGNQGATYYATDLDRWYRDDGAAWAPVGTDVFNVVDQGAVGDGVTDSTVALQAAINAAVAAGGEVFIPAGTFVSDLLTVGGSCAMRLDEAATLQLAAGEITALIAVTGGTLFRLHGGTLDGQANTLGAGGLLDVDGPTIVDIDTTVTGSGADGIRVVGATAGRIAARVTECGQHGIALLDSSDITIAADVNGVDSCGVIVKPDTTDCERITVEGTVRNCARVDAAGVGVYLNSGDVLVVRRSTIRAKVYDAGWIGIFPGGDYNACIDCVVDGAGIVTAATGHAYWIHDSAHVTLAGCIARRSVRSGFLVGKAHAITLTGCIAELNAHAGFQFERDATASGRYQGDDTNKDASAVGCIANNNSTASTNTYPGYYVNGWKRLTLLGCHAHDYQAVQTQQRGVLAATNADTDDISIIGCDFQNNISGAGINVATAYLSQVLGNTPVGTNRLDGVLGHVGTQVGFFSAAPVAKQADPGTAVGTDAAVINAIVTALRNYGLVV